MSFWGGLSVHPSVGAVPSAREGGLRHSSTNKLVFTAAFSPCTDSSGGEGGSCNQSDLPQPSYLLPSPSTLSTLKYPCPCGPNSTSPFITFPYSTAWVSGSGRGPTCSGLGCRRKLEGKEPRDPGESFLKTPAGHCGLGLSPVGGECLYHMLMWAWFPSCVRCQGEGPPQPWLTAATPRPVLGCRHLGVDTKDLFCHIIPPFAFKNHIF